MASLPRVDSPSHRTAGLHHRVGSPTSGLLTKQPAHKTAREHVRPVSCPPVEGHDSSAAGLPVQPPTPPCEAPSPRELQAPSANSLSRKAHQVTQSWETRQILAGPDRFQQGTVIEASRKVRLGIVNTDPELLSRESASLIMHRSRECSKQMLALYAAIVWVQTMGACKDCDCCACVSQKL